MRKTRIVHVLRNMGIGGTEKCAQIFSREMAKTYKDYYDVAVLYNAKGDLSRFRLFEMDVGSYNMIPYMHESQGTETLETLRPDIVHVFRSGIPEWPAKPKQSLLVETNVFGFINPNNMPDKSLFMSNWLLQQAKKIYGNYESFDFINNPVDMPASDEKMNISDDLAANAIILGRCGRPDDGIYDDISIKAIVLLQSKYPIHFIVVAPPPRMLSDLERFGISHTIIEPTIYENILSRFYNTLDIYCHSRADGETYGNNIAEAMAHGKPVITHVAVPSHPGMGVFQAQTELVEHNNTGYITSHSINEYANALEKLILDKKIRKDLGHAGLKKFTAQLSSEISARKLHNIYQDLIIKNSDLLRR